MLFDSSDERTVCGYLRVPLLYIVYGSTWYVDVSCSGATHDVLQCGEKGREREKRERGASMLMRMYYMSMYVL